MINKSRESIFSIQTIHIALETFQGNQRSAQQNKNTCNIHKIKTEVEKRETDQLNVIALHFISTGTKQT